MRDTEQKTYGKSASFSVCSDTDTKTKAISFISESETENEAVNKV